MIRSHRRPLRSHRFAVVLLGCLLSACTGTAPAPPPTGQAPRGEVIFGTRSGSDACHVGGQVTVFAPSDPIYVTSTLSQPLRSGGQVLGELDVIAVNGQSVTPSPNDTASPSGENVPFTGTLPFTVSLTPGSDWQAFPAQAPYDCIGTTKSIGAGRVFPPFGSNVTYRIRFRDASVADGTYLASGALTIIANFGGPSGAVPTSAPTAPALPTSAPTAPALPTPS